MISRLKQKALRTARRTALFLIAGITAVVGVGFLTATAWIFLESRYDSLIAALVVGLAYVATSTILLMIGRSMSDNHVLHETTQPHSNELTEMPPLASAFIFGLNAGLKVDERRSV